VSSFFSFLLLRCMQEFTSCNCWLLLADANWVEPVSAKPSPKKSIEKPIRPLVSPTRLGPAQLAEPGATQYNNIIIIYNIFKKTKIFQNFKNPFKKICIISHIFLPILHNIELYIYIVRYRFGIKILGFLRNIS